MYPIPASLNLTLSQIADHWSRKIKPRRSSDEIRRDLGQAWWRGEFQSNGETTRLRVLRALFKGRRADLPFWVQDDDRPQTVWEHPDGSAEVLLLSVIRVPSADPESWIDQDCHEAYEAIAQDWGDDVFSLIEPAVVCVTLSEPEFTRWTQNMGYKRPKFWATNTPVSVEHAAPSVAPLPKNRPGKPDKFVSQYIEKEKASGGRPTRVGLEVAAKSAGIRGGRNERRAEFERQMGGEAPVRGRPSK